MDNKYNLPVTWESPDKHLKELLSNPWFKLLAKLYDIVHQTATSFFTEHNVCPLIFPVTTGTISSPMGLGSDSEPVMIDMLGHQTYLADSMQFLLELGVRLRPEMHGVWYIMPSFRGEMPDSRHLNEFIHLEAEIKGGLDDVIEIVEALILHLTRAILEELEQEIENVAGSVEHLSNFINKGSLPQIKYFEAVKILDKPEHVTMHPAGFSNITQHGEKELLVHFGGPVWLTHHPTLSVPFYQKDDAKTNTAMCADLLLGIGETVGAGARHITQDDVVKALKTKKVDIEPYKWYVEMKKISPISTAGFGMGLERFFAWVCQVNDIRHMQLVLRQRDVVAFP